ncbi:MAG: TetR/AcrR family transcriptional regulator [Acidimicrobiia bacterium]
MAKADATTSDNPYRRSLLRRQRSLDTRAAIVRAAARLWTENGYDTTTVEDICTAAGIGRSTYYLHFESKEQLLGELTWATSGGTAADVERAMGHGDLDEQIAAFVDGLSRRMESVPRDLAALVLRTSIGGMERLGAFPDDKVDFGLIITRVLRRAQAAGHLRTDVDAAELGAILGGMTMEAMLRWATGHTGDTPLRDSLSLRFDLVLDGLRT